MKIKVGIFFGGPSREREISFAGGRTVYDNLDKTLFDPIPIFVDSFRNYILLDWEYIYKGSIRDFYPPVKEIKDKGLQFQIYAESLGSLSDTAQVELGQQIGRPIERAELKGLIDVAFLALHGVYGEDGQIQKELADLGIAYTGSGIEASQVGMDKAYQKELMGKLDFARPKVTVVERLDWIKADVKALYEQAAGEIGFPLVIRPANQGSSIGVSIIDEKEGLEGFELAVNRAFFREYIPVKEWLDRPAYEREDYIRMLADLREGLGFPLTVGLGGDSQDIYHPQDLLEYLDQEAKAKEESAADQLFVLEGHHSETRVILESFIKGKEFSCIVMRTEDGGAIALPPTEIIKGGEVFDYRSKYLPGLSRKETPIKLADEQIEAIRRECERLFTDLGFQVYARIDGFFTEDETIFLNDPNTTSGMLPSSFFFHQAAEIGLNPSQYLTLIIRLSLQERLAENQDASWQQLLANLDSNLDARANAGETRKRIAVILGGGGAERHISVESGRNVYEKLGGSEKYVPQPIFLTPEGDDYALFQLPINLLLKDNADDIRDKILNWQAHPILTKIRKEGEELTKKYAAADVVFAPRKLSFEDLAEQFDGVFIALHGRPGEDGQVQERLEALGLAYNGSSVASSSMTIDKYKSLQTLRKAGLPVALQLLQSKRTYDASQEEFFERVEERIGYPLVAKPVDDGCSAAVKVIRDREQLAAFCELMFGTDEYTEAKLRKQLKLKPKEEFPTKAEILFEELISAKGADKFLEITGGLLTNYNEQGEVEYFNFEPSETPSSGEVLSLEEKFLAGEGQNITPARLGTTVRDYDYVATRVKGDLEKAARILGVEGYCRIDAFVRVFDESGKVETLVIEVNSLPGMTPATAIFHQAALVGYKPYQFIDQILEFGFAREARRSNPVVAVEEEAPIAVEESKAAIVNEPTSTVAVEQDSAYVTGGLIDEDISAELASRTVKMEEKPTLSKPNFGLYLKGLWRQIQAGGSGLFKSGFFWKNLGAILGMFLLLFLLLQVYLNTYTQHGESVQVHNYIGMDLDDAKKKARTRGFRIEATSVGYREGKPLNEVLQQDPEPLSRVKENRTIYLQIVGQPEEKLLPELTTSGYEYDRYARQLRALDIRTSIRDKEYDPKLEENTITRLYYKNQEYSYDDVTNGIKVMQGDEVEFVVSVRQTNRAQIPNLVCKSYDEAYFLINGARLVLGEVRGNVSNRSDAYIVRQEPAYAPGSQLEVGAAINLYLSYERPASCGQEEPDVVPPPPANEETVPDSTSTDNSNG